MKAGAFFMPKSEYYVRQKHEEGIYLINLSVQLKPGLVSEKTADFRPENGRYLRYVFLVFLYKELGKFERRRCLMPRMSKKRKQEWSFFLNDRNRITFNELCLKCINDCKQSFRVIVVQCPLFVRKEKIHGKTRNHQSK